jgi:hypothetical protein
VATVEKTLMTMMYRRSDDDNIHNKTLLQCLQRLHSLPCLLLRECRGRWMPRCNFWGRARGKPSIAGVRRDLAQLPRARDHAGGNMMRLTTPAAKQRFSGTTTI